MRSQRKGGVNCTGLQPAPSGFGKADGLQCVWAASGGCELENRTACILIRPVFVQRCRRNAIRRREILQDSLGLYTTRHRPISAQVERVPKKSRNPVPQLTSTREVGVIKDIEERCGDVLERASVQKNWHGCLCHSRAHESTHGTYVSKKKLEPPLATISATGATGKEEHNGARGTTATMTTEEGYVRTYSASAARTHARYHVRTHVRMSSSSPEPPPLAEPWSTSRILSRAS